MNLYHRKQLISKKISKKMDKLFNQLTSNNLDEETRFEREEEMKLLAEIQTVFNLLDRERGNYGTKH